MFYLKLSRGAYIFFQISQALWQFPKWLIPETASDRTFVPHLLTSILVSMNPLKNSSYQIQLLEQGLQMVD